MSETLRAKEVMTWTGAHARMAKGSAARADGG